MAIKKLILSSRLGYPHNIRLDYVQERRVKFDLIYDPNLEEMEELIRLSAKTLVYD